MLIQNKKNKLNTALLAGSILLSAQAIKPTANAASVVTQSIKDNHIVAHAADSVSTGAIGVDTASYQDTDLTKYKNAGAQFAIVKLTEGTTYVNPKGAAQYASAQSNGLMTMAYFFATFGTDSQEALNEARFFVQHAQAMGIPTGSYLAVDYESGDGNNFSTTDRTANTNAILNAMNYIRLSGYQPLIYTGQNFMDNYIDEARLSEHYPNSEWIAAYTQGYKASDEPIFDWKPPYPNMVMWQFTPNYNGQKTDASVAIQNMQNKPDMEAVIDSEGKGLNGSEVHFLPDGTYRALAAPLVNYNGNIGTDNSGTDTGVNGDNSGVDASGTDNNNAGAGVDENVGNPDANGNDGDSGTSGNIDTGVGDNIGNDVNGSTGDSGTNDNVGNPSASDNIGIDASGNIGSPNVGENAGDSSVDISGTNSDAGSGNTNDNTGNENNNNTGDSSVSSGVGSSDNTTENENNDGHGWNGSMSSVAFKKGFSQSNNNVGNTGNNVDNSNKNNSNVINLLPEDNNDNVINNQPLPSDKKEQEVKNEKIAQANNQQSQQSQQNQQNEQNQNSSNDLGNSSDSTNSDLAQTSTNKDKQNIWVDLFGLSAMSLGLMKLQKKDDAE